MEVWSLLLKLDVSQLISSVKAEMMKMSIRAILGHQENDRSRKIEESS